MRMKTVDRGASIEAFKRCLGGRMGLRITGATEYWLEDDDGRLIGDRFPTSGPALAIVLEQIGRGISPDQIHLLARTVDLDRYEIGSGPDLQDMAEAAAGIPARRRVLRS